MIETKTIFEYGIETLPECNLKAFEKYLICKGLSSALKIGTNGIRAKSHVGVIKFKNTQIEILPKLISPIDFENSNKPDEMDKGLILKNLIYMLSYTKKLNIKITDSAKLSQYKNPFLEVLIREYAKSLFDCLKRLTPKNYVRQEGNFNFLRGRLKFNENISYNYSNNAKFYCEFDEFSENNILNQFFLFVSICLYQISKDGNNKKLLKLITDYYADVNIARFDKAKADKIVLNRNQAFFNKPFKLAKMFIENSSIDLSQNKIENITLLWDMNVLFEEFIAKIIKTMPGIDSITQKSKRLLKIGNDKRRDTRVDVLVEKPEKIVIDTKYKKFKSLEDVASADIYQIATYCLLHNTKRAILLYPKWDEAQNDISSCTLNAFENNRYKIEFRSINLRYKNLSKEITTLKYELKNILEKTDD